MKKNHTALVVWTYFLLYFTGCKTLPIPFSAQVPPPKPNYSDTKAWAALPEKIDHADIVPYGDFQNRQASAPVDVFFVHPTLLMDKKTWTGDINDSILNYKVDSKSIENQATVFNGSCRVYAPRYRQMNLGGFYTKDTASKRQALELAYEDVKAAFQYYLTHYNHNRPFILASHSQGTRHATKLLKNEISGKPIEKQLIAAYLVGFTIPNNYFPETPICTTAEQTGCVVGWNSYLWGKEHKHPEWYKDAIAVNPISWTTDSNPTDSSLHKGVLWYDYKLRSQKPLKTQTHNGLLWVQNPVKIPYKKNFHVGDYNLFWVNIRENIALRVDAFLKKQQ